MDWWRVVRLVSAGFVAFSVLLGASAALVGGRGGPGPGEGLSGGEVELVAGVAASATVGVRAVTCQGTVYGSGFVTGDRLVTNRHLASGVDSLGIHTAEGTMLEVSVTSVPSGPDLALGRADGQVAWANSLALAPGDPVAGDPVVAAGWVNGQVRWLEARVQLVTEGPAYGDGPVVLLDRPVDRGWSGGPVLDRSGRVVAVIRAVDLSTGLTMAVPVSQLQEWLQIDTAVDAGTVCVE